MESQLCTCLSRLQGISNLIRRSIFVEVQGGDRLPQQGFEWPDLRGAAGTAVGGTRDGGMDRGHHLGLVWRDIPERQVTQSVNQSQKSLSGVMIQAVVESNQVFCLSCIQLNIGQIGFANYQIKFIRLSKFNTASQLHRNWACTFTTF